MLIQHQVDITSKRSVHVSASLLCLGSWSLAGMVMDEDVMKVAVMKDVEGDDEEFKDGWDAIKS